MKRAWARIAGVVAVCGSFVGFACTRGADPDPTVDPGHSDPHRAGLPTARAYLAWTGVGDSGRLYGQAAFEERNGAVNVVVDVSNVAPGLHGLHVHANADCSDAGLAAGGHFNPLDASHGFPDSGEHHPGDFGNIEVGPTGAGRLTLTTPAVTVSPGDLSVVGHALVLHEGTDDGTSQPTGDAGGRIGCGVVVLVPQ